jgi:hypothetical protein
MRSVSIFSVLLLTIGVSCGGDDGGGSGSALSDEQFCSEVSALDEMDPSADDLSGMVTIIEDLAAKAPNDELRDAMLVLAPVITEMGKVDENDEDAMTKLMEIMMDPEVIAAGELIEKYSSETCGIDESSDDTNGGSSDTTAGGSGNVFDDMEAGDISDYVQENGADLFPNGYVSSSSMSGADGYTEIVVDFAGSDTLDGVGLCDLVFEAISSKSTDSAVRIVIQNDTVDVAVREVDGECSAL